MVIKCFKGKVGFKLYGSVCWVVAGGDGSGVGRDVGGEVVIDIGDEFH